MSVCFRKSKSDEDAEGPRCHRRKIAESGGGRTVTDLKVVEPVTTKVHAFDGRVSGDDECLARGHRDDRSIVADLPRGLSPLCQKRSDEIELFARAQIDVAVDRLLVRHVGTAGRVARTGTVNGRS